MIRSAYRTHHCGMLSKENVGEEVKLAGWIHRKRDHGNLLFIDLRDHYGITQLVVNNDKPFLNEATHIKSESVVTVTGKVVERTAETVNKTLPTGEIEVVIDTFAIESAAEQIPL